MSFYENKEIIEENDVVILYLNVNHLHSIKVTPKISNKNGELIENVFQTTYGALKVESLIGKKYGSKVTLTRGWAVVLQPTPELWTLTLPHRTQIIYTPDISLIVHLLDLTPGKIVIESGTGSGSLSHALIRAVRPSGHLHTFDFHEKRVEIATEEFKEHGLQDFVTVKQRDACLDGFGDDLINKADAAFLDLPAPWLVVKFAVKALKKSGGKWCSFSPCIEQVQQTCSQLESHGFVDIQTVECLQRELFVKQVQINHLHFNYKDEKEENPLKEETPEDNNILTVTRNGHVPGHTGFITIATLPPEFARVVQNT